MMRTSGIGGFFLVSTLAPSQEDNSDRYSDHVIDGPGSDVAEAMARARDSHEDAFRKMSEQHDEMMRQAEDSHRRAMERMPSAPNFPAPNFGRGFGGRRN